MSRAGWITTHALLCAGLVFTLGGTAQADDEEDPLAAMPPEYTDVESRISFGALYNDEKSYRLGEYTGVNDDGYYFTGDFDLWRRGAWDDTSSAYWRLRGSNVGLNSRNLFIEYGHQGRFRLSLDFDQVPELREDTGLTFLAPDGASAELLPPGWISGSSPAALTLLGASSRTHGVQHERRHWRGAGTYQLSEDLSITTHFARETKQGTRLTGAVIAASGGNPRAAVLAEPVNYETRKFDGSLDWAGDAAQVQLGYHLSWFNNRENSFSWQNPYSGVGGWSAAADYPASGTKGLAPDNRFDQITLAAGYNLAANTRIAFDGAFGRMTQNDSYLPYTSNPGLVVPIALPRGSFDGKIDTTYLQLALYSRPMPKLRLDATWRYDDRDNRSSRTLYTYVHSDAADQDVSAANDSQRLNLPYSYKKNELELGARYELAKRTWLGLEYGFEMIDRNYSEVDTTRENRYGVTLNSRPLSWLSARLHARRKGRNGSRYDDNAAFLQSHNPAYTITIPLAERFENHPDLRRYYLADRDRTEVGGIVSLIPTDRVQIDLHGNLSDDDYKHSYVGRTDRTLLTYTVDVSFNPTDEVTSYAFFTRENLVNRQHSHRFTGGSVAVDVADPTLFWVREQEEDNDTIGAGFEIQLIPDTLSLQLEYLFTWGRVGIQPQTNSGLLTTVPLHDAWTRLHNARVGAEYRLNENLSFNVAYLFEKFDWNDFYLDNLLQATTSQVINTGEGTPDYNASIVAVSVTYRFH